MSKQIISDKPLLPSNAEVLTKLHLEMVVGLLIHDLKQRGGPDADDFAMLGAISERWQASPSLVDTWIRRAEGVFKCHVNPHSLQQLAEGIAIMAFCPGGITLWGRHWEASA